MFEFAILQFVNSKPKIIHFWDEEKILAKMLEKAPGTDKGIIERVWYETIKEFKKESIKVR